MVRARHATLPGAALIAGSACAVAAAALGAAAVVEHGLGIAPCELCLVERWPWRVAIGLSLLAMLLPGTPKLAALWLLVLDAAGSVAIALLHVGVEWHLWPSPFASCRAQHLASGSIADQLLAMPLRAAKPCDGPTFLLPGLPLSMAAMNLLLSLSFLAFLAISVTRLQVGRGR